jgi:hypothetical protein
MIITAALWSQLMVNGNVREQGSARTGTLLSRRKKAKRRR